MNCKITYTTNAGILIENENIKIMIDGIHSKKVPGFSAVPDILLEKMINGRDNFKDIDYLLFTHYHYDHLDFKVLNKYLEKNISQAVILPDEKSKDIENFIINKHATCKKKILLNSEHYVMKEIRLDDIRIQYFKSFHDGKEFLDVQNYSYILHIGNKTFLHIGDTEINKENLEILKDVNIDFAFLNFPFLSLPRGRRIINDIIKPEKLIIFHLPLEKDDEFGYRNNALKCYERNKSNIPETYIFLQAGDKITLAR